MANFVSQFQLSDEATNLQREIQDFADTITSSAIIEGQLIKDVELDASQENIVTHSLGRAIRGYIVTGRNANSVIYDSLKANRRPDRQFVVKCSADVTASFWVF
jgi:hypothetical protein